MLRSIEVNSPGNASHGMLSCHSDFGAGSAVSAARWDWRETRIHAPTTREMAPAAGV